MALMTLIVMAPAVLMKKPPAPVSAPADSVATVAPVPAPAPDLGTAAALPPSVAGPAEATPEDTVLIHTALATYGISTRGARLVTAALEHYLDQAPGQKGRPVNLTLPGSELMGLRLVVGADTLRLDDWIFETTATEMSTDVPNAPSLATGNGRLKASIMACCCQSPPLLMSKRTAPPPPLPGA